MLWYQRAHLWVTSASGQLIDFVVTSKLQTVCDCNMCTAGYCGTRSPPLSLWVTLKPLQLCIPIRVLGSLNHVRVPKAPVTVLLTPLTPAGYCGTRSPPLSLWVTLSRTCLGR
jgi:hypothetical protein